ncbi:hypothetical protein [Saccharopolyspora endophytica]|uniref:Uncharacterized protein n=1 Tax=Saccharopolyspora endophytica TaxID=543886 RepID=A0ABS5DQI6_9PSEU|nr:hypothetical protein [Saccharopolyspora endophytica]MBQ0928566.1 hypothetical protein [Saccharopolyspora endophytica]
MFEHVEARPPAQPGDDRQQRPPVPVRVDLAEAFVTQPPASGGVLPDGWDMTATVDGELTCWLRDTAGRWWGEVRIRVHRGDAPGAGGMRHVWWLPAHAIRRR